MRRGCARAGPDLLYSRSEIRRVMGIALVSTVLTTRLKRVGVYRPGHIPCSYLFVADGREVITEKLPLEGINWQ